MPRILVADDNTNIQKMVALAFQGHGIEVTSVGNGEAAVRKIPDLNPDLVLADIFMPVRNGYELCEWIKKDSKYSHIPVLLLVGAFDPLDEKEARRVGADGVLKKPFIPPDPLIAMVVSALEKNPKIAAELHKPKDSAASQQPAAVPSPRTPLAPAPPAFVPAASAVELPARITPKPLPSFPDPTPDEAELAYAFGTGQRAMDDLADEDAKALKSQDEAAEEFDGASTTSDWRRSRMDFEIPEESANKPAFSAVDELESNFTPEKVPQKARPQAPAREAGIPQQPNASENAEVPGQWSIPADPIKEAINDSIKDPIKEVSSSETFLVSADDSRLVQRQPADLPVEESPAHAISAVESAGPAQEIEAGAQPVSEVDTEAAIEPEPSFASRATHWMDMMGSASELPPQDWFASAVPPAASVQAAEGTELQPEVASVEESVEPLALSEIPPERDEHVAASPSAAISLPPSISLPSSEDEPFFADEENEAALETAVSELHVESTHTSDAVGSEVSTATPEEDRALEAVAKNSTEWDEECEQHHDEPRVEASAPREEATDWVPDSEDSLPSYKEPDLIEPPAVHVTPEPLLVIETHHEPATYGERYEETRPAHSFQLPAPESRTETRTEQKHATENATDHETGHEAVERPVAQATSPMDLPTTRAVQHSSFEFSPSSLDERMPAVPEPRREDLDGIPYLNPPPNFREFAEGHSILNHCAADSVIVDAVVEKVLQRIEPQLRELLSQNVLKPIVEAILHGELEGKQH